MHLSYPTDPTHPSQCTLLTFTSLRRCVLTNQHHPSLTRCPRPGYQCGVFGIHAKQQISKSHSHLVMSGYYGPNNRNRLVFPHHGPTQSVFGQSIALCRCLQLPALADLDNGSSRMVMGLQWQQHACGTGIGYFDECFQLRPRCGLNVSPLFRVHVRSY